MRYDPRLVAPIRKELTDVGFEELLTVEDVQKTIPGTETVLCVVNSVCGCAAGSMRPAIKYALERAKKPTKLVTVFAGMEIDAVEEARAQFLGYPPSSPSMGLFKDGKLVHMVERKDIEGKPPLDIAESLIEALNQYC
jgi:putative YphP/YqiW family bacilliredoxin